MSVSFWNQSAYSLLHSTCKIQELVAFAKADQQVALGLCDDNVLSGAIQFYQACQQAGIKPIIGMCVREADEHYIAIAPDQAGYQALVTLSTAIQLHKQAPIAALQEVASALIVIIPQTHPQFQAAVTAQNATQAHAFVQTWQTTAKAVYFGALANTSDAQAQLPLWQQFCQHAQLTAVALQQTVMPTAEHQAALAVLEAIGKGQKTTLAALNEGKLVDQTQWSKRQFALAFHAWPQAVANTEQLAATCEVTFDFQARFLPAYPLPTGVERANVYLTSLCMAGLKKRYGQVTHAQYERLQYELQVIDQMGFNDYFLIVWDFIKYARQQQIAIGPGRGSAVGSLVAYCLGITNCDPLAYGLLFERFLNPERVSMPDIDIDIEDERRQEVIDYVREKYGEDRVVQIATFGTFATKAAFREVARILDASPDQLTKISQLIPSTVTSLAQAYASSPALQQFLAGNQFLQTVFKIAQQIEGLPRNVSTHAAGIIIGANSLAGVIPLQEGMGATAATQYTMNELEALGMLKMDFLGLRNLSLMKRISHRIEQQSGTPFSLQAIPLDDPAVYTMLQHAQTTGIFQLESGGMRAALRQIKPTSFEDIVATLALFRPGPMENIPVYSRRKQGEEAITYPEVRLQAILAPTYGIIIYQEQIMQIATELAGYSLGEADILRRAISKKKEAILEAERQKFVAKCIANAVSEANAEAIYDLIVKFANYGFNKSHAVAYSYIAYQLAYLKVHYATFFWCELLNSVIQSDGKVYEYLQAAKQQQLAVIKPSIQTGVATFQVVDGKLQVGLLTLKNVGINAIKAILAVRAEAPFTDFKTTMVRLKSQRAITKATLAALIDAGAFDCFELTHATMLQEIERTEQQVNLLNFLGGDKYETPLAQLPEFDEQTLMEREVAVYGYYLFTHPVLKYRQHYPQAVALSQVKQATGTIVTTLVYVERTRNVKTKTGEVMLFMSGSDEFADCDFVAFPKIFAKYADELMKGKLLRVKGKVEQRQTQTQVVIYDVQKLEK